MVPHSLVRILLIALVVLAAVAAPPARADLVVTLSAPPGDVRPGTAVTVTLYFLNTGPDAATPDAPAEIPARLTSGGRTTTAALRRTGPLGARPLAAGQFAAVPYALAMPVGAAGATTVELQHPGTPRTVLAVAAPPAAAGPPATRPAAAGPNVPGLWRQAHDPDGPTVPAGDSGIGEYIPLRFSAHEPVYFIAGPGRPNAKFQVSFKYQVFNPQGSLVRAVPPLEGLHVAYSQTSLWDLAGESSPFFDSSYRPEVLWSADDWRFDRGVVSRLGLQAGVQHESNGRGGDDSRSLNVAYVRPSVTVGDTDGLFVTFAPRLLAYLGDLDDNPDLKDYRGHGELRLIAGDRDGLQVAATARVGDDWDKGSLQLDVSYPLRRVFGGNVDLYLHGQYFNGFGESLLEYNDSTNIFRLGVSLVR